jgi:hypothetical protein
VETQAIEHVRFVAGDVDGPRGSDRDSVGHKGLLFHDLRRSAVRNMVQKAGISEARAMAVTDHWTHETLRRYNIIHLSDAQQVGTDMDAWATAQRANRRSAAPGEASG